MIFTTTDRHPVDCTCCTPADAVDERFWEHANFVAARIVAGIVTALALIELHHLATGIGGVRMLLGAL